MWGANIIADKLLKVHATGQSSSAGDRTCVTLVLQRSGITEIMVTAGLYLISVIMISDHIYSHGHGNLLLIVNLFLNHTVCRLSHQVLCPSGVILWESLKTQSGIRRCPPHVHSVLLSSMGQTLKVNRLSNKNKDGP